MRRDVELRRVGVVELAPGDVAPHEAPRPGGVVLQIEPGEAVCGALRGALLEDEPQVVLPSELGRHLPDVAEDLESECEGFLVFVKLLAAVRQHELVEAHHADEVGGALEPQVGRALAVHGQQCQGAAVACRHEPFDELPFLGVGFRDEFHALGDQGEEVRVVAPGENPQPREVERHVLDRGVAHLPGLSGVFPGPEIALEIEEAAAQDLVRPVAVEEEMGVALLGGRVADVQEELLVAGRFEKVLRDPQQGLGEKEGAPQGVAVPVDLEQGPGKSLGGLFVVPVHPARELPAGTDSGHVPQVPGDLPAHADFREDGLPAARDGKLGELEDKHLGDLLDLPFCKALEVGGEEYVHRVPSDRAREVTLQHGAVSHHVRQEDLGVPGGLRGREGVGQRDSELLDELQGLARAVGPVDVAQVVQVDVPPHVGVPHLGGEHTVQGVLLLDPLGEDEVGGLGTVGQVSVFLVLVEDELADIVEREAEARVHAPGLLEAAFHQLRVDEFADQGGRQVREARGHDLPLHVEADRLGRVGVDVGLQHEGVDDALAVPVGDFLVGGPDEERDVGRFLRSHVFSSRQKNLF